MSIGEALSSLNEVSDSHSVKTQICFETELI